MPTPAVCATVTASTMAELRRRRDAVEGADLVELRLDTVRDPSAAGALEGRRLPVVVTCRPTWEGGRFAGAEEERRRILADALALGAEYVDVEWRARFAELVGQADGRRIVLSTHDFDGVPRDLNERVRAMQATGAEVVKVAAQTTCLGDCVPLLDLAAQTARDANLILIGMGEAGVATRVLAGRAGAPWTSAGALAELGQVDLRTLLDGYRFRSIGRQTGVYGLVGAPIGHSVSPAMHNAAFAAARLDAVYLPLPAASAADFVRFARAAGLRGASVTVPFKVPLFEQVDEACPVARRIGAINKIRIEGSRWVGANTDASGFLSTLRGVVPLERTRAAVLGAGGAARAVASALAAAGAAVRIHARDRARAEEVARLTAASAGGWPPAAGSWDLLVNCTPVGMHPKGDETPLPAADLTGACVYDLIYNPPLTRLLREARQAGCQVVGGLEMLVAQAQEQFQWWTGVKPQPGVMREAALKQLAEFARDEHHLV
ncbi:MAG: shikimate dehydrogenase [Acidobacteria bacterium]|nr:shikimate dehydrogenase [Acidobacteriota bacterium]